MNRLLSRGAGLTVAVVMLVSACSATTPVVQETPSPTSVASPAAPMTPLPLPTADWAAMKAELAKRLQSGPEQLRSVESVLVAVGDETVVDFHQGTRTKTDSYRHVWSVTKSVVSMLVGIAIEEGQLRLDQTLGELLPSYRSNMSDEVAGITLRQLLTMTAGFPADAGFSLAVPDPTALVLIQGLTNPPGSFFDYSNVSAHVVSAVLAQATGQSVLDYAREKLFDPLQIPSKETYRGADWSANAFEEAGFAWVVDRKGVHSGAAGLRLRADDMAKIGRLYADLGRWQGRQLVPESWVRESTRLQLTQDQRAGDQSPYGYFWWIGTDELDGAAVAEGSYGQLIIIDQARRLVIVVACRDSGPYEGIMEQFGPVLVETIIKPLRS